MRKLVTFLMTLLVGSSISYANADSSLINFEAGYRRDNINWKFEAPSCDPLIETSTRFKDIDIFQIGLSGRTSVAYNFYGRASADWGWVIDGDYEESTKLFANFPGISEVAAEFKTEDKNIIDDRFVVDLDVAVGYPFYFCDCTISLSPVVGYAFNEQNICVDGTKAADFSNVEGVLIPASHGDDCCFDKFISRWYGPFIGVDFEYRACDCLSLYAQLEYHWTRFRGKRHTQGDFDLFDHFHRSSRYGDGWAFKAGVDYDFSGCWIVGLSTTWKDYSVSRRHHACREDISGFESLVGVDGGSEDNKFRTKHSWRSYTINVTVGRLF